MADAQEKLKLDHANKYQSSRMQNNTYSHGNKVFVWYEQKVNSSIRDFIELSTVLRYTERFSIDSVDRDCVMEQYKTPQIESLLDRSSILYGSITERRVKTRHVKTGKDPDKFEQDGDNLQFDGDKQSYGERSIAYDGDCETKACYEDIKKAHEILK